MRGDVELVFLCHLRAGLDRWQFKYAPHERFDRWLDAIAKVPLFRMKHVHFFPGSGHAELGMCYEISDQGMWFLRPHFANYDELAKEAEGKNKSRDPGACARCGMMHGNILLCVCDRCREVFCLKCLPAHIATHEHMAEERLRKQRGQVCPQCGDAGSLLHPCNGCGKSFCYRCETRHQFLCRMQRNFTHTPGGAWANPDLGGLSAEELEEMARRIREMWEPSSSYTNPPPPPPRPPVPKDVRDAFAVLGIAPTSDVEQIKKAFKAKALVTHPDLGGNHNDMIILTKAREVALGYAKRC